MKCKQSQFYQNNKSRFLKLESVCWILVLLCTMNNTQHAHYKIWLCLHQSVGQYASAGQYASVYTSTYLHCEVKFYRNIAEAHGARFRLVELQATNFLFLCIASVQNKKNQISGKSRWNVLTGIKTIEPKQRRQGWSSRWARHALWPRGVSVGRRPPTLTEYRWTYQKPSVWMYLKTN